MVIRLIEPMTPNALVAHETAIQVALPRSPSRNFNDDADISHDLDGRLEVGVKREDDADIEEASMCAIHEICGQVDIDALFSQAPIRRAEQCMWEDSDLVHRPPSGDLPSTRHVSNAVLAWRRDAAVNADLLQQPLTRLLRSTTDQIADGARPDLSQPPRSAPTMECATGAAVHVLIVHEEHDPLRHAGHLPHLRPNNRRSRTWRIRKAPPVRRGAPDGGEDWRAARPHRHYALVRGRCQPARLMLLRGSPKARA